MQGLAPHRRRWVVALFLGSIGLLLAPGFAGFFHWGHEFIPSKPWNSLKVPVYLASAAAAAGLFWLIWHSGRVLKRSAPANASAPPTGWSTWRGWQRFSAVVFAILFATYWFQNMQAIVVPKVLHSLAAKEPATMPFTSDGRSFHRRYECDHVVVATADYEDFGICMPDRDYFNQESRGLLRGTKSFYGFWVEAIAFDQ